MRLSNDTDIIYGIHPVRAALNNPERHLNRLFITRGAHERLDQSIQENRGKLSDVILQTGDQINHLLGDEAAVHQGALLEARPLTPPSIDDLIDRAEGAGPSDPMRLVILDQVTDPHNVGAILRSAAVFGIDAVIAQDCNAAPMTPVVAKAAAGAVEHVPYIQVTNLARTMEGLKEAYFFAYGLDETGERSIGEVDFGAKTIIVLGAEGAGLRRLIRDTCDELIRLPAPGKMSTLNVSNAAAVSFYELARD
jgi:23S rRNA (guanosine2251-2'-O)-methyltransferase